MSSSTEAKSSMPLGAQILSAMSSRRGLKPAWFPCLSRLLFAQRLPRGQLADLKAFPVRRGLLTNGLVVAAGSKVRPYLCTCGASPSPSSRSIRPAVALRQQVLAPAPTAGLSGLRRFQGASSLIINHHL
jgi:hypothetical protein